MSRSWRFPRLPSDQAEAVPDRPLAIAEDVRTDILAYALPGLVGRWDAGDIDNVDLAKAVLVIVDRNTRASDVEPSPDFDTAALTALVDNRQMPDTAKLTVTLGEFRAAIRAAQESPGVDWLRVAAQDVVGGWARLGYDMGVGIDRLRAALHTETSGEPR